MENRVSVVTLGVADVDRARAFYEAWGGRVSHPTATSCSSRRAAWSSPSGAATSWPTTVP